jgi:hypothetical protein
MTTSITNPKRIFKDYFGKSSIEGNMSSHSIMSECLIPEEKVILCQEEVGTHHLLNMGTEGLTI